MKRHQHFILLLCMLVSVSAKSQFTKGDRLIGGAVNVYSSSNSSTYLNNPPSTYNNIGSGLVPRYSWVTKDNIMNGIFLNANYSHSKTVNSSDPNTYYKNDSYGLGLGYFIRKYKNFNPQFGWFMEYNAVAGYSFIQQKQIYPGSSITYKSSALSAGLNVLPGLYYKVSSAALIEVGFGGVNASYSKGKSESSKTNAFNIGLNFPSNFTVGMQFLLGHKQNKRS